MFTVSVVGRPNVGKSSLFNRILGKRIAVVDDMPGVTRDRHYRQASWNGCDFMLVDTGGLDTSSKEGIPREIAQQVSIACDESSVILFIVDATVGVTDLDLLIAKRLRKLENTRVLLAINKAESKLAAYELGAFCSMGFGEGFPVSALHGKGVGDLLDALCGVLLTLDGQGRDGAVEEGGLKIAVVGRPNAGKSSLVNKLIHSERMIVSALPGTTRDSIDTAMTYLGGRVVLIDTAGLRKKSSVNDDVEYYCNVRALESIRRCDVCVLMVDAVYGVEEQDLKIVRQIVSMRKGLMVCFNKWDLVEKDHATFDHMVARTKDGHMELRHAPMVSVSALTGQRTAHVLDIALQIKTRMETPLPPVELRETVKQWIQVHPHPVTSNEAVQILSCDQAPGRFPLFRIYAKNAKNALESYKRYLANKIYDTYDFDGCPVVVEFHNPGKPQEKVLETWGRATVNSDVGGKEGRADFARRK